ncbi:MAG: hypothetical protein ACLTDF_03355 [Coprococcus sp.]
MKCVENGRNTSYNALQADLLNVKNLEVDCEEIYRYPGGKGKETVLDDITLPVNTGAFQVEISSVSRRKWMGPMQVYGMTKKRMFSERSAAIMS